MALRLNCIKTKSESINNKAKKIIASNIVTLFIINGRLEVRSIFLSRFLSTKSFIMQPALLIKKDPAKNSKYHFIISKVLIGRDASANQQGHINNMKPIGLSKRIKSRKDLILLGIE